jgi:hypothetical protein
MDALGYLLQGGGEVRGLTGPRHTTRPFTAQSSFNPMAFTA